MQRINRQLSSKQLIENFKHFKHSTQNLLMLVVKADAYGHCANWVISTLQNEQIDYFAVATVQEAQKIQKVHQSAKLFILSEPSPTCELIKNVTYTVYTQTFLKRLSKLDFDVRVHIKVNTGLNRLGCNPDMLKSLISNLENNITLEGIYTHLTDSQNILSTFTQTQVNLFNRLREKVNKPELVWHIGNTEAHSHQALHADMIRLGYGLYKNVMSIHSYVMAIQTATKGQGISYGPDYVADETVRTAVIPIGYADGYSTTFSNVGYVYINGYKCKVIGRVCMDMIMVNIMDYSIQELDKVEILGNNINLDTLSKLSNLNPREITCSIGNGKRY